MKHKNLKKNKLLKGRHFLKIFTNLKNNSEMVMHNEPALCAVPAPQRVPQSLQDSRRTTS